VVLAAVAGLVHNVGLSFEAGTRGVGNAERLLAAVERIGADLAAARYVHRSGSGGDGAVRAFFAGGPRSVTFVSAAGVASGGPASGRSGVGGPEEEIVVIEVEEGTDAARLVRRRAPWLGPRTLGAEIRPRDPVVLLDGPLRISFAYADRSLAWTDRWAERADMPRFVRLVLRDRATGAPLYAPDFEIRSDAPPACARAEATPACVPLPPSQQGAPSAAPSASSAGSAPR
jgi:hypothetical protein